MSRVSRFVAFAALGALVTTTGWAQFNSAVVGFNDTPLGDPAQSQEMFRIPEFNADNRNYILVNDEGIFNQNAAFRNTGLQSEGAAALQIQFTWDDPSDPNAWVRMTTFNGPSIPNPSLHTDGKVRFKLTNRGEFIDGEIGICIGIRETNVLAPQLGDGGTTGDIEWVGVDETPNGITAGEDGIVDTIRSGDDVQAIPFGTDVAADPNLPLGIAVIEPGPNGVIDTVPAGDDEIRFGYVIDDFNDRGPVPAVTIPVSSSAATIEFDLVTGDVTVNGVTTPAGIAPFTGNGILDPSNSRGTLEHIAIVNVPSDPAALMTFAIDELQFESPEADPVNAPEVLFPVIAGDTVITVQDIQVAIDQVVLLRNGTPVATENFVPPTPESFEFTGLAPAVTGDVYTATQRSAQDGTLSAESEPVVVLPEPPVMAVSILLDEGGTGSVSLAAPGWEWVGVSNFSVVAGSWNPIGVTPLFLDDAVWQTLEIPLDNDDVIIGSLGGNGALAESPSGFYTIDTVWFNLLDANQPTPGGIQDEFWEVLIDGIELIGPGDVVTGKLIDNEDGTTRFGIPRGQTPDDEAGEFLGSALFSDGSYDGGVSHRGEWRYDGEDADNFSLLQRISGGGTSELIPDDTVAIRFHMVLRGARSEPNVPLPVVAPVIGLPTSVTVAHDAAATSIQLFVNGVQVNSKAPDTATESTFNAVSLAAGDSIAAKQVIGGVTSDFAYPRAAVAPIAPALAGLIVPSATQVEVTDVNLDASAVAVLADGIQVGTAAGNGTDTVVVPTSALGNGAVITATQTVNTLVSDESGPVIVATPAPVVVGPLNIDDTAVTVTGVRVEASEVKLLVDAASFTLDPNGADTVIFTVPGLNAGQIVTATQTIAGVEGPESALVIVANTLFINEFQYDDRTAGEDLEYVEIYNSGGSAIDISDYVIELAGIDAGELVISTITIPAETTIAAGGYWTIGDTLTPDIPGAVIDVVDGTLNLNNAQSWIALYTPGEALLDAVTYETNKGVSSFPASILTEAGNGIWGNSINRGLTGAELETAQARWLDGLDTNNGGRDWGNTVPTPGFSNNLTDRMPYLADGAGTLLAELPEWRKSFVSVRPFNPATVDDVNLTAIPASPDGGNALIAWDDAGGGNSVYLDSLAKQDVTLETYIYIEPNSLAAGETELSYIGIKGTVGSFFNLGNFNGATGLVWALAKDSANQVMYLVDENDGGDGANGPIQGPLVQTIVVDDDPALTGWQRILLESRTLPNGDEVGFAIFGGTYGSRADGQQFVFEHDSPGAGGAYIGYTQADPVVGVPSTVRPPTLDAYSLTEPVAFPSYDLDNDGDIDIIDYAIYEAGCQGESGLTSPCTEADSDGNGDGEVGDGLWFFFLIGAPN